MIVNVKKNTEETRSMLIKKDIKHNWLLYLMILPVLAYYFVFCYLPMTGILMAFKNYTTALGNTFFENLMQSKWVGLRYFREFFTGMYFKRIMFNTFKIGFASLLFGFPAPIILALLINELKSKWYKKTVQTITYLPHFISIVVICGMIRTFTASDGVISQVVAMITQKESLTMLNYPNLFVPVYVLSGIWCEMGWGSIIYLSALAAINSELYEAATIDGAGRWKQTLHVTIPGIMPTIMIMLILRMGQILGVGYEKIILLYNDMTKQSAEVISTYVYQRGLVNREYGFSTAVGLFNSLINITFLVAANYISKRVTETSLW